MVMAGPELCLLLSDFNTRDPLHQWAVEEQGGCKLLQSSLAPSIHRIWWAFILGLFDHGGHGVLSGSSAQAPVGSLGPYRGNLRTVAKSREAPCLQKPPASRKETGTR